MDAHVSSRTPLNPPIACATAIRALDPNIVGRIRQGFLAIFAIVFLATAIPGNATFPGKNGRIAFVQDGEIVTMNSNGGDLRQLTHLGPDNSASWPSWSADGKQIVFNEFPPPDKTAQIWIMDADGSNQRLLLGEPDFSENRPSFSPDSSKVVFGRCQLLVGDGDTCAIYTIAANGAWLTAITSFQRGTNERSPMFSPDGRTIAFIRSADEADGFLGVTYLIDADGENLRRITDPEPCLIRPDWSPDGRKITAFAHYCNPRNETIAVIDADGRNLTYLTHNGSDYFNGPHDTNPAWSPEGDLIVFERDAPDLSSSSIYVVRPDGKGMQAIAHLRRTKNLRHKQHWRGHHVREIEEDGSVPRWGVAAQ